MRLTVEVFAEGLDRPPVGAPVHVQVLDTSLADAEATVVTEEDAVVTEAESGRLQTVELDVADAKLNERQTHLSVFVHVDADADGQLSGGDFITTRSYPLQANGSAEDAQIRVDVDRIAP